MASDGAVLARLHALEEAAEAARIRLRALSDRFSQLDTELHRETLRMLDEALGSCRPT